MRKMYISLIVLLLMLCAAGLAMLLWGAVFDQYLESNTVGQNVVSLSAALNDKQLQKERNLARWYNLTLRKEKPDTGFLSAYLQIMDFGAGRMGYLEIPALSVLKPIAHETGNTQASDEVVHQFGTSLPVGGKHNCPVLYCGGEGDALAAGDAFSIHILDTVLTYQVAEMGDKMPKNQTGEDLCVLWFSSEEGALFITGVRTTKIVISG